MMKNSTCAQHHNMVEQACADDVSSSLRKVLSPRSPGSACVLVSNPSYACVCVRCSVSNSFNDQFVSCGVSNPFEAEDCEVSFVSGFSCCAARRVKAALAFGFGL
uniref:Uncharacterized protein n=1 Tax=Cacopsylla melanoneura TaxID=428564 RepID=A0A8D8Z660_9HEMI